jgi:phosphohistidine phosphatase
VKLFLLRHGEADWPDWNRPDHERPLTPEGKAEMRKIAALLKRIEISLDLILTSPLPRAAQTAGIVAEALGVELREEGALAPGFSAAELTKLLGRHRVESLMIVGHEPDFSQVIADLTGGRIKLRKAGLALIELKESKAKLLWLLPPKIAVAAADSR